jgi:methylmalonyl-CoA mutase N-terminal domain/subunit
MAFTLCSAIQYAEDCLAAGMDPDRFLPRFTFFFDISVSLFEEVAKFRAGRRVWAKLCRERFGAKDPRSWRFKFHGQTSGVDLTRQQPLNNIARVTTQAMAGIFGGLQSLHTDGYDEVFSTPTTEPRASPWRRRTSCARKPTSPTSSTRWAARTTSSR